MYIVIILRSISNHNLWRVFVRHHYSRGRKAVAESIWVVGFERLFNHASMMMVSCLKLITRTELSQTTYWAWETIFSTLLRFTRLVAFVLKGMQIDMPLDIKTPLHEVTLVIEKALLDLSNLLWWWTLIFSSVSRIFCILWLFYSASKFAALSTEFFGDLGDV